MPAQENQSSLELFRAATSVPDAQIDLPECALLIAQAEYPDLDRSAYRRRLDEMGREAAGVCTGCAVAERLAQLSRLFSGRWGFHGNRDAYYDPRNSFLNDVLDRRTGIPITLSVVYMEVGRRAGMDLVGVGMPSHFLVGYRGRDDVYVDAFSDGALLARADCAARLRELRPDVVFRPELLEPVGPRVILTRMLNNLVGIYLRNGRFPKALEAVEIILCLQPGQPEWLRHRALLNSQLKNYSRAIADLESYLERAPEAADREEMVRHLTILRMLRSSVN